MNVEQTIIEIVALVLRLEERDITPELSRESHDAWDSARHITLILSIEDQFDITLSEDEIPKLLNVADLIDAAKRHLADR